jgi:hypothetical protein
MRLSPKRLSPRSRTSHRPASRTGSGPARSTARRSWERTAGRASASASPSRNLAAIWTPCSHLGANGRAKLGAVAASPIEDGIKAARGPSGRDLRGRLARIGRSGRGGIVRSAARRIACTTRGMAGRQSAPERRGSRGRSWGARNAGGSVTVLANPRRLAHEAVARRPHPSAACRLSALGRGQCDLRRRRAVSRSV